ncbi:lactonase family protein [Streptomyces sp. AK02-01A]|uniref:lactonase family protein n=1 Tax=Streptomyces sp. AK02-01A TaxID=3028648 RepID=UPI0029B19EC1|nr:lactonase family protein [Streptomyces sp. AK02-01A]MDX3850789.1 lactonase family protein [Streptomyces sp. AK02-01A]
MSPTSGGAVPPTGSPDGVSRRRFLGALAGASAVAAVSATAGAAPGPVRPEAAGGPHEAVRPRAAVRPLFLGTYTSEAGGGTGVGLAAYDSGTGGISGTGTLTGVDNPSYLAVHPDGGTLYTVNERRDGGVTAIALSDGGAHTVLGTRGTGGAGPTHLSVHPGGRWLLSANYTSGSVAVHPIDTSGALGERTDLVTHSAPPPGPGQDGPHAHQIITSPDGGHVLAVDLGNDTVYTYRLDTTAGTLTRVSYATVRAGAGPRHLTFHPSGAFAYLANELDNTVVVCAYDAGTGVLTPGEPQSTGAGGAGSSFPAQLVVTPDGGFAYLANRGHNSLTRYAVEADGARLRLLDTVPVGGDFPRQLALSPTGELLFAANQRSNSVTVFHVNPSGGELRSAGEPFTFPVAVCALPL